MAKFEELFTTWPLFRGQVVDVSLDPSRAAICYGLSKIEFKENDNFVIEYIELYHLVLNF